MVNQKQQLHYNGIFIEPKTSCRYLGIMIDNNLNFDILRKKNVNKNGKCYYVNLLSKTSSTIKSNNRSF